MKTFIVALLVTSTAIGCSASTEDDSEGASVEAVTVEKIPAGWDRRCVTTRQVAVHPSSTVSQMALYAAQCHDWFYLPGAKGKTMTYVKPLPRGAEAGTKVDATRKAGWIESKDLSCFSASSGIDPGAWMNSLPACGGGTGAIAQQDVEENDVKRDAMNGGAPYSDSYFSEGWLEKRGDGFSFHGKSRVRGTIVCNYRTAGGGGFVAQAYVGVGDPFWCQLFDVPGATFAPALE